MRGLGFGGFVADGSEAAVAYAFARGVLLCRGAGGAWKPRKA